MRPLPLLAAVLLLGACAASDTAAVIASPIGMESLSSGGSGAVFTTRLSGSSSAKQLAQGMLRGLQDYFGGSAEILQAITDPADTRLQAAFRAQRDGRNVMGMLVVEVQGGEAPAVVVFDDATAFGGSIDRLMSVAMSGGAPRDAGDAPAAAEPLTRTPIPDGSGSIDLGRGWVIRYANQGAMDIQGPVTGSGMSLGAVAPVPYTSLDPVEALRIMTDQSAQQQGRQASLTILDATPMEWVQGGKAALIRYRIVMNGESMDYFSLLGVTPYEANQVFLYTSYIQAPTSAFPTVFPTAIRSWASWSINPAVFAKRLQQAAQSMRATGELLTGGSASASSKGIDGVNAGWGQYIRGVATLEDGDRNRSEVDQRFAESVVQNDPGNFRIVPTSELIP